MRSRFQEVLTEAVKWMAEHGMEDRRTLDEMMGRLRLAAEESLISAEALSGILERSLLMRYNQLIRRGGWRKYHTGMPAQFTIEQIEPELRQLLSARIAASANLIRLHRDENILRIMQRFSGWASSVPAGGSETIDRREVKKHIAKSFYDLPFEERRLSIDQGHKLIASINQTIAEGAGAIAVRWRHVHQAGYDGRPDHEERDNEIYALKGNWAIKAGLMKKGHNPYYEDTEKAAEAPYCRCWVVAIYDLNDLPEDMLTRKGVKEVA